MIKRILTFLTILLVAFALVVPAPAQAVVRNFTAEVYSWDGSMSFDGKPNLTRLTTGVTFKVLATGSDTAETLYYYDTPAQTSLTNPVTTTNFADNAVCADRVRFATDPTDGSDDRVDLMVINTVGGGYVFFEDFNYQNDHTIIIDERPGIMHAGAIWFTLNSDTETTTGIDFSYDTAVFAVTVEVVTLEGSSTTMDVGLDSTGTNGDIDGFINGISTASTGFPDNTITTIGDLLDDGTDVDPFGHTVLSANEQTLTYVGSAGSSASAAGYIHYTWARLR